MTVALAWPAAAAPPVIYDRGRTAPLAPYLEGTGVGVARPRRPARAVALQDFSLEWTLPVRTPALTPGHVERRALAPALATGLAALPRPLFVVGSDARSRDWLARQRSRLQALGAIGLLVQAETAADLAAMRSIGEGLVILPVAGGTLAEAVRLRHYPALISRQGIEP